MPTPLFPKTAMCFRRARGEKAAAAKLHEIAQLPIEIVGVDMELGKLAARLKAEHNLPYADCFAAAVAQLKKASPCDSGKGFLLGPKYFENRLAFLALRRACHSKFACLRPATAGGQVRAQNPLTSPQKSA